MSEESRTIVPVPAVVGGDEEDRQHTIILTKTPNENVVRVECGVCEMKLRTPDEYHPREFCLLKQAGADPWELVQEGSNHAPKRVAYQPQGVDYPVEGGRYNP